MKHVLQFTFNQLRKIAPTWYDDTEGVFTHQNYYASLDSIHVTSVPASSL